MEMETWRGLCCRGKQIVAGRQESLLTRLGVVRERQTHECTVSFIFFFLKEGYYEDQKECRLRMNADNKADKRITSFP